MPVDLSVLALNGSLFVTRPTLMTYTAARQAHMDLEGRKTKGSKGSTVLIV